MANYLSDRELYYEIVISKDKGKLTKNAERMLILIANRMIKKLEKRYRSREDRDDCLQQGLLHLFNINNWMNFNENKYTQALPYFSEICKRGFSDAFNIIHSRKTYNDDNISFISLNNCNNGKGLSNI